MLALREKVGRSVATWLRASGAGGVLLLGLCLCASEALADPDQPPTEYFTGFEVSDNYARGYVDAGYAFGKAGYAAPGFRLRAVGAYGRYDYQGSLFLDGAAQPTTFDGQDAFAAALIGYEFRPGRLIVKLFADVEGEDQHIVPHDPNNSVQVVRWGCGCRRKAGSICRREAFSPSMQATAPPSRNIGHWRGWGID